MTSITRPAPLERGAARHSRKWVLLKNALANVLRGGAGALVALAVPPFLVHAMPATSYSAWALVLQLSAYAGLLDFGVQTAVGRFIAQAAEREDALQRDRVVSTAFALLVGSAALAAVLLGTLIWQLPHLFPALPEALLGRTRLALALVGGSTVVSLPFSVYAGLFIGLQRFEIPAAITASVKLLSAAVLIVAAQGGGTLVTLAAVLAAANLLTAVLQYVVSLRLVSGLRLSARWVAGGTAREIASYCLSLSVWSFAMLLVSGLDTTLVGFFDFRAVAFYSVAASLVNFVAGMQNMLFAALMPEAAAREARGDTKSLGEMLVTATRCGMFLLLATGLPLILAGGPILTVWVGSQYAAHATRLLQILTLANIVRLSAAPYATLLIGTGQQRLVITTPLLEGASNLVVSIVAARSFGAIGVAWGTLAGAVVGLVCHFAYNMPRTQMIQFQFWGYVRDGLLRPLLCLLPICLGALLLTEDTGASAWFTPLIVTAAVIGSLLLFWSWGLLPSERGQILGRIRHRRPDSSEANL